MFHGFQQTVSFFSLFWFDINIWCRTRNSLNELQTQACSFAKVLFRYCWTTNTNMDYFSSWICERIFWTGILYWTEFIEEGFSNIELPQMKLNSIYFFWPKRFSFETANELVPNNLHKIICRPLCWLIYC